MFWMNQSEIGRWNNKLKRYIKKIPDYQGQEIEQLDLDLILNFYIEEFHAKKKKTQKLLTKQFVKQFQEQDGIFSYDEVKTICKNVQPQDSFSRIVEYPGEVTFSRCFLYALTAGTNGFDISSKDFTEAAFRMGVDNPYPTIQRRINYYGNDTDLEFLLSELISTDGQNQHLPATFGTKVVSKKQSKDIS